jgi:hypothetical protein
MAAPADGGAARAAVSEPARGPGGYRERYLGVRIPSARALPANGMDVRGWPAGRLFGADGPHDSTWTMRRVERVRCRGR